MSLFSVRDSFLKLGLRSRSMGVVSQYDLGKKLGQRRKQSANASSIAAGMAGATGHPNQVRGKGSYVRPVDRFMPARNADTGQGSVGFSSRARQLGLLRTASKA